MKLLALDTSSDACSVALGCDDVVFERHALRPKEHTQLLLPMIEEVLDEAGIAIRGLDAIVAGIGPGSFIGVRIAVSVAQGLAFAGQRKIVPVSSLAAVAAESFEAGNTERVAVAQDAHMREVYLARFERGANGLPGAAGAVVLHPIGPVDCLAGAETGRWHAAGGGWRRYPELLTGNEAHLAGVVAVDHPRARYLLPMAIEACRTGATIEPDELVPAYVRHHVAKPSGES